MFNVTKISSTAIIKMIDNHEPKVFFFYFFYSCFLVLDTFTVFWFLAVI